MKELMKLKTFDEIIAKIKLVEIIYKDGNKEMLNAEAWFHNRIFLMDNNNVKQINFKQNG